MRSPTVAIEVVGHQIAAIRSTLPDSTGFYIPDTWPCCLPAAEASRCCAIRRSAIGATVRQVRQVLLGFAASRHTRLM